MGPRRYWIYFGLFTLIAINYIDRVALSVGAKPIAQEFGLNPVQLGYLFSSFLWAYVLLLLPMGMAVDRFGVRLVAGLGMLLWSLATVCTGLATSLGVIMSTRLAMGAAESTSYPAGGRLIREWAPRSERGMATAIMNSGSYAGPAIGALLISWLISLFGWRASFVIAGAVGLFWLVGWFALYRRPEDATYLGAAERQLILEQRDAESDAMRASGGTAGLLTIIRSPTILGLGLTQGCSVYTQYLFLTWLPSYLENVKHLSIMRTGIFTAAPYAIAVVLCICFGALSDRLLSAGAVQAGRRRIAVVVAQLSAAVVLLAPLVDDTWLILGLITVSLTGLATAISLNITLTNDLLRSPQDAAKAVAAMTIGGNVFGVSAPIVTGYVIDATGSYNWAFVIAGLLLIAGATICLTMTRRPIEPFVTMRASAAASPTS